MRKKKRERGVELTGSRSARIASFKAALEFSSIASALRYSTSPAGPAVIGAAPSASSSSLPLLSESRPGGRVRGVDRGVERGIERGVERGIGGGVDRGVERGGRIK